MPSLGAFFYFLNIHRLSVQKVRRRARERIVRGAFLHLAGRYS